MATGRRKESVARVALKPNGRGKITINGRDIANYFSTIDNTMQVRRPLLAAELEGKFDISANVNGGGVSGQAGAVA
jgi:small subunit ribosomal protein S9